MKIYHKNNNIIIENKLIPFKGFSAMNLFGIIFTRDINLISDKTLNHESIHTQQMLETLIIGFYVWYVLEWFIKLFVYGKDAYYNISFEREAYLNDFNSNYLKTRKRYNWIWN